MKTNKLSRLAVCAALSLATLASLPAFAGEGHVKGSLFDASYVIGIRLGDGTLSAEGQNLRFRMRGLTILSAGIAGGEFNGKVSNLNKLEDFAGHYSVAEAGAAYVIGAHVQRWTNEKGVVIEVSGVQVGAELRLGGGGLNVSWIDQPAAKPVVVAPIEPKPISVVAPRVETLSIDAQTWFEFDKHTLSAKSMMMLDDLVAKVKSTGGMVDIILVHGHTDRIGSEEFNMGLGQRRATEVAGYLATHGLPASALVVRSRGESQPVVECKGVAGKDLVDCLAPNRRAEIHIEVKRLAK